MAPGALVVAMISFMIESSLYSLRLRGFCLCLLQRCRQLVGTGCGLVAAADAAQTKQSLTNGKAILEAAGGTMADVVKTTVFLADMNDFAAMNAVYATFFPEGACPARSAVQVARLPKDAKVEIEFIANM